MSKELAGKRFLIFVEDIYEDLELWYPKLRLIEAGALVVVAGPQAHHRYEGKNGYPCRSDAAIADMQAADFDGVVVIPKKIEQTVVQKANEKVHAENLSRNELLAGKTLREVYDKYKAL